jgi:hypothetical protein
MKDVTHHPHEAIPRPISVIGYGINTDKDYINQFIPYDDLRSTDLSAKLLAGVVAMILHNAGIPFRSNECDNIGLFVGQDHLCAESIDALDNSISERGINHLSASAFTRLVINYPAGVCCRLFGLKGPVAAIAAKPDNGLTTLCLGADFLARRNEPDLMIVASVDEQEKGKEPFAGAAGLLLRAGDDKSPICLKGWSMSRNFDQATEEVLKMSGLKNSDVTSLQVISSPACPDLCTLIDTMENNKNSNHHFIHFKSERDSNYMGIDIIIEKKD